MNVKEFMETPKNSNEIEKEEAATALNFKDYPKLVEVLTYSKIT